jgi:hypothetical protein
VPAAKVGTNTVQIIPFTGANIRLSMEATLTIPAIKKSACYLPAYR